LLFYNNYVKILLHISRYPNTNDNGKPSEKMGRKAIGPEMDCKAAETIMAYTISGVGFFIAEAIKNGEKKIQKISN